MKKISIKAEDVSGIYSSNTIRIGPLWLSSKDFQFTIYEGDTDIIIDDEEYIISDFPVHVYFIGFV